MGWYFDLTQFDPTDPPTRVWTKEKLEPLTESMAKAKRAKTPKRILDILNEKNTSAVVEYADGKLERKISRGGVR